MKEIRKATKVTDIDIDALKNEIANAISILGEPEMLDDCKCTDEFVIPELDDGEKSLSIDAFIGEPLLDYINYIDFTFNVYKNRFSVFMILGGSCHDSKCAGEYFDATCDTCRETGWYAPFEPYADDSFYLECSFSYKNSTELTEKLQKAFAQFRNPKLLNWLKNAFTYYI